MAKIGRRAFLKGTAGVAGVALAGRRGWAGAGDEGKIAIGVPVTHSDWMLKGGVEWGPAGVRHMLDACKASGWTRVYWRACDAGQASYRSTLMQTAQRPDEDNIFNPLTDEGRAAVKKLLPNLTAEQGQKYLRQFAEMDYGKFDSLASAVEYGHQIGIQVHAWVTINEDDHGWGWASKFSKAHPECRWVRRDGKVYHSQMSFAFPEVREYKLGLLRELLEGYAIDGFFLDWIRTGDIRDNPQTDAEGVANSGYEGPNVEAFKKEYGVDPREVANGDERWVRVRARSQTEFMRDVRKWMGSQKRRVPVSVMVGHPWHYRGTLDKIDGNLRGLLLDVRTWAREGLMDSAVAAGYYRDGGNLEKALGALKEETEGKVPVWAYGWVPTSVGQFEGDYQVARKMGAAEMLLWEGDYIDDRPNKGELQQAMRARSKG